MHLQMSMLLKHAGQCSDLSRQLWLRQGPACEAIIYEVGRNQESVSWQGLSTPRTRPPQGEASGLLFFEEAATTCMTVESIHEVVQDHG